MKKIIILIFVVTYLTGCSDEKKDLSQDISKTHPAPSEQSLKEQSNSKRKESSLEKQLKEAGVKDPKNITDDDVRNILKID